MTNELQREHEHEGHHTQGILAKSKWVLVGFLIVIGYFLFTEHRAHVFAYLPFLLLLACPVMHLFMHHGHGGHQHGNDVRKNDSGNDSGHKKGAA